MGRSVDYLSHAQHVAYLVYECEETCEWMWFQEGLIESIRKLCPSLVEVKDRWDGRETLIILENKLCEIGISSYFDLVSISIRTNDHHWELDSLAQNWIDKIWPKLTEMLDKHYETLNKVARASNGESFYEHKTK